MNIAKQDKHSYGKAAFEKHAYAQGLRPIRKVGLDHDFEFRAGKHNLKVAVRTATSDQEGKSYVAIPHKFRAGRPFREDECDYVAVVVTDKWDSGKEPVDHVYIIPTYYTAKACIRLNPYQYGKYSKFKYQWNYLNGI